MQSWLRELDNVDEMKRISKMVLPMPVSETDNYLRQYTRTDSNQEAKETEEEDAMQLNISNLKHMLPIAS